ncbi:hypothetical protein LJE86_06485, partial [bacterium BMS3Abin03]|nr:hypothetical protein [bacterium BMS3Abin03]
MKKRIDWDLILNYLDGNVSDLEEKKLREWADENRRNSKELELLTRIWKSPASDLPKPDLEKAIQNVKEKMTKVSSLEAEQYSEVFKIDHK